MLAVLLGATACVQSFDATSLGVPVSMGIAAGEQVQGTPFKTNVGMLHGFFGLITLSRPNLRKALATQLVGANEVAQLRIKSRSRWSDVLLTILTAGLLVPRTVTYEGVIIDR